jgi:hypothetical protein
VADSVDLIGIGVLSTNPGKNNFFFSLRPTGIFIEQLYVEYNYMKQNKKSESRLSCLSYGKTA